MKSPARTLLALFLILLAGLLALAVVLIGYYLLSSPPLHAQTEKQKGIKWVGNGLTLELAPLSNNQVQGFFEARGFSSEHTQYIAKTGCIFRSSLGNDGIDTSDPAITIELTKWRILAPPTKNGKGWSIYPPLTTTESLISLPLMREDWDKVWQKRKISDQARTAFYWALFPTKQTYQATDYNWGMISFALPSGTKFDLEIHWKQGKIGQIKKLTGLECGQ